MATKIFVDQENGDESTILSKDRLKLSTGSAKLQLKGHPGKVFGSSGPVDKASRKALGNVNKQVAPKAVPARKDELKVKKSAPVSKKVSEGCLKPNKQNYPEIETCIPYDPLDFETFDVPEAHKLSHLCLAGVPLMVNKSDAARLAALTSEPAPMAIPVFSWESDFSDSLQSFLATLDDITLDLPPMLNY